MSSEQAVRGRHAVFHPLAVKSVQRLTDDAVTITFEVPESLRDSYRFEAGQHLTIRAPAVGDEVRRNYSICAPAGSGVLQVAVKRLPDGVFSAYALERLAPGDTLEVMTPTGRFGARLDPSAARMHVAFAAGSGITPLLSILATALAVEPCSEAMLVYGNRTSASIMFLEEVADLKDRYPERFSVLHVLSGESRDVSWLHGRIDEAFTARLLDTLVPVRPDTEWYACGPAGMIEAVRGVLLDRGVATERIHRELFHVGPVAPRASVASPPSVGSSPSGSSVTVVLDGRASTFQLPPDGASVLAGTLAVRPDAPFACRGGVCGTCRARLLEGSVEMDACYALEPEEVAAGYVLTCQSHPRSERVRVDFDA